MKNNLIYKYDVPVPRYTSYPTVPYWTDSPSSEEWLLSLNRVFRTLSPWSLYVHIPFCETLCTFCGCNTAITRNHGREEPYIELLLKEFGNYKEQVTGLGKAPLEQFHFGGGTPTFLSPENLCGLAKKILSEVNISESFDGSIEVDPRKTESAHLSLLRELGFSRVSLGVQDFDPQVQSLIHRVQSFGITEKITHEARQLGYASVNFDLIYGLPCQTEVSMMETMEKTWQLKPDRIALYSLAVVPWIKPAQRLFKDSDLPKGQDKRRLYEISRDFLLHKGYMEIGMDHFALPGDSLSRSRLKGELHRNFMGYVEKHTPSLLGLGVSAISETSDCFHQNEKALPVYERRVSCGEVATLRGHKLTTRDQIRRRQILEFMTCGQTEFETREQKKQVSDFLREMIQDELIEINGLKMKLTGKGKPFLRNACMALDERLLGRRPDFEVFSKSI